MATQCKCYILMEKENLSLSSLKSSVTGEELG